MNDAPILSIKVVVSNLIPKGEFWLGDLSVHVTHPTTGDLLKFAAPEDFCEWLAHARLGGRVTYKQMTELFAAAQDQLLSRAASGQIAVIKNVKVGDETNEEAEAGESEDAVDRRAGGGEEGGEQR